MFFENSVDVWIECRLARIFRFSRRSIDTAARHGGDEFATEGHGC
jgi:hypothetical protein